MDKKTFVKMIVVLGIAGLAVAGPAAYAIANEGAGAEHKRFGEHKDLFKDLNLTPEQKAKVEAQREAQKGLRQPVQEQLKAKMQALHEALSKPAVDRAVLKGLIAEINALKGQLFSQRIDGVLALKETLTPEQFAKVQAKFAEQHQKHGGWKKDKD